MCRPACQTSRRKHASQRITKIFRKRFRPSKLFDSDPHLSGVGYFATAVEDSYLREEARAYALAASPPANLFFSTPWSMTTARSRPTAFITVTRRCAGAFISISSLE